MELKLKDVASALTLNKLTNAIIIATYLNQNLQIFVQTTCFCRVQEHRPDDVFKRVNKAEV